MMKNLGMFFGLPRRGARAVLPALFTFTAACVLSVSSAQAALLLHWVNGTLTAPDARVTSSDDPSMNSPYQFTGANPAAFEGYQEIGVSLTLASGWTIPDLQITFTLELVNLDSITVDDGTSSQVFPVAGNTATFDLSDRSAILIPDGGTLTETFNLSAAAFTDPGTATVTFSDIQFNGTVTPVPEPVNYALAAFGLLFVGVGAGRFYLGRRRLATAS